MLRYAVLIGLSMILISTTPASALTTAQKMETCKFGANDQKLTGAKRKTFLTRCMAKDDAPAKPAKPQKKK